MTSAPHPDWHLQEWIRFKQKKQIDLVGKLGWHKTTAHRLWHGRQPYRRDQVNQVAAWLDIEPYELLMSPGEAVALRRQREAAYALAAERDSTFEHPPQVSR